MGKTFDQSLIDTATIPMSMIDPEDMQDTTSEEFVSMRRVQQGCHSELTNREDFPFNKFVKTLKLMPGQNTYPVPDGRITEVRLYVNNQVKELAYDEDIAFLAPANGEPERFTVTYNPNKLQFYPTPNMDCTAKISYISTKNIILADGDLSYEIEIGSTLNMPERYQHLYFDALEYYVLATNLRKLSNPRYQPTIDIFRQKWATFLRGARSVDTDTVFTF